MSNKKRPKTNITKISAHPSNTKPKNDQPKDRQSESTKPQQPQSDDVRSSDSRAQNTKFKPNKKSETTSEKPLKSTFILIRPFVALGRYLRDSWREIRQVRWPNRKLTWKMTFAVLIYCAIFIVFIVLLDMFFTFIFNLLLSAK